MRGQGSSQVTSHPAPALHPAPLTSAIPGLPILMRGTLPDCLLLPLSQIAQGQLPLQAELLTGSQWFLLGILWRVSGG